MVLRGSTELHKPSLAQKRCRALAQEEFGFKSNSQVLRLSVIMTSHGRRIMAKEIFHDKLENMRWERLKYEYPIKKISMVFVHLCRFFICNLSVYLHQYCILPSPGPTLYPLWMHFTVLPYITLLNRGRFVASTPLHLRVQVLRCGFDETKTWSLIWLLINLRTWIWLWVAQDSCEYTKIPSPDLDRNWQNFHFSHSTVRISGQSDNPLPLSHKNWPLKGELSNSYVSQMSWNDQQYNHSSNQPHFIHLFGPHIHVTSYNWESYADIWLLYIYIFFIFSYVL